MSTFTQQEQNIFEKMNALSLVCKTVSSDAEHLNFLLRQLQDPKNVRPLKALNPKKHTRSKRFKAATEESEDLRKPLLTSKVSTRAIRENGKMTEYGTSKETDYTKKTAVTLLPQDGQIDFYQPRDRRIPFIGLLFDLDRCDLKKEKYIFETMAETDTRSLVARRSPCSGIRKTSFFGSIKNKTWSSP